MNKRAKTLAVAALGIAALWLVALGLRALILAPVRSIDAQIVQLQARLESARQDRNAFLTAETFLRTLPARTYGPTPDLATSEMGTVLTRQILQAGLRESDFTRIPVGERRLTGAIELGWTVQGEGPLDRVIDLLFLLDQDARLHRLDGLALSSGSQPGRVRLRLRFLTLLPNPAPPPVPRETPELATLDHPARPGYDVIIHRDLLRPYVPRPPGETTVATAGPASSAPSAPVDPYASLRDLKVVSLSTWAGEPEIHVRDAVQGRLRVFKPGDEVLGLRLVAVDYRPLPLPDNPDLMSFSRVILVENNTWYAVECGQTFGQRRVLESETVPDHLRP